MLKCPWDWWCMPLILPLGVRAGQCRQTPVSLRLAYSAYQIPGQKDLYREREMLLKRNEKGKTKKGHYNHSNPQRIFKPIFATLLILKYCGGGG